MKRTVPILLAGLSMIGLSGLANAQGLLAPARVHAQADDIRTEGQVVQKIRVTFESEFFAGIDLSTLGDGDILVTGPNGYKQRGTFISVDTISPVNDPDPNGAGGGFAPLSVIVATYHVFPSLEHDGPWSPDQNGAYSIQLRQGEVSDTSGVVFPPSLIGSFRVALGDTGDGIPVLPSETRIRIFDDQFNIDPVEPRPLAHIALIELLYSQPNVGVKLTSFIQENNTFIANFEALSFPGNGEVFPAVMHVHREEIPLGILQPGDYRVVVRSQNQNVGEKEFTVGGNTDDTSPPDAVTAGGRIISPGNAGHLITVVYEDPSGVDLSTLDGDDLIVQDAHRCLFENQPNAAGDLICLTHARLAVEFVEANPSNTTGTRIEAVYRVLPPPDGWSTAANGVYQIHVVSREVCDRVGNCTVQKVIGDLDVAIQPVPSADLTVDASNPEEVTATVLLTLPPQHAVTDTSVIRASDGTIILDATALPTPGVPNDSPQPSVETLTYVIGPVSPGQHLAVFNLNGERLASRGFVVEGKPGPIPLHIAFINIHEGNASHFAEVGVVLDRPGIDVLSWGEVIRDGRTFLLEIVVGLSDATVDPVEPNGNLPEGWDPAIGGFPFRLVTHEYPLGVLEDGEFVFVVTSGGTPVARKAFRVGGTGPDATLTAEDIEMAKEGEHPFQIGFHDASGLDHESIQTAAVTVRGPDGFEATAELKSYITTLDPLGVGASATYAVRAPGGAWDAADSGAYRISIDASAVLDRDGNALADGQLGGFKVRILPDPPEPPGRVGITTRLDNGIWIADVSVNDDSIRITDWGDELIRHGRSILALASAVEVDPNNNNTPGFAPENDHSYRLGELAPGYYVFVFKTDLGHCGIARIRVPGMGDGGFHAWRDWLDAAGANHLHRRHFGAYAFAMRPDRPDEPEVHPEIFVDANGRRHGGLRFRRLHGAMDVAFVIQCSRNMTDWQDAGDLVEIIDREIDIDGTEVVRACLLDSIGESDFPFLRVVARQIEP